MEDWSYIWKKNLHTTIESYIINLIYGKVFSLMFSTNIWQKNTIGNIYMPPKFNNSNPTIEYFMLELNSMIDKLPLGNSYIIFTGDFNINRLEINTMLKYQAFFDLLLHKVFIQKFYNQQDSQKWPFAHHHMLRYKQIK